MFKKPFLCHRNITAAVMLVENKIVMFLVIAATLLHVDYSFCLGFMKIKGTVLAEIYATFV